MSRLGKTGRRALASAVATFMMLAVAAAVPTSAGAVGEGGNGSANVGAAEDLFESSKIRGIGNEGRKVEATATPVEFRWDGTQLVADVLVKAVAKGNGEPPETAWERVTVPVTINTTQGMGAGGPGSAGMSSHGCDILNLELGATNINLLGLVIDLSQVNLDIVAEPGPGQLLGNLLCAVAGLLDDSPLDLGGLTGLLEQINGLLDQLLGGLLGGLSL